MITHKKDEVVTRAKQMSEEFQQRLELAHGKTPKSAAYYLLQDLQNALRSKDPREYQDAHKQVLYLCLFVFVFVCVCLCHIIAF